MEGYEVSVPELEKRADELENFNERFKNLVQELVTDELALRQSWDSEAQRVFSEAFERDKAQMDDFAALISKYCTTMRTIAANYKQAEMRNTNTASTRTY